MNPPAMFSVEDANERLPYVRAVIRDIVALAANLQERQYRLDDVRELHRGDSPHADEFEEMERAVDRDFARFDELEEELNQVGVHVVDRNTGLVEMRSTVDDHPVWINWQPEEAEFMYWRGIDDDSMMRRPLLESVGGFEPPSGQQSL